MVGRYLKPISADDLLFGNVFEKPIRNSLPWGTSIAMRFVKYVHEIYLLSSMYYKSRELLIEHLGWVIAGLTPRWRWMRTGINPGHCTSYLLRLSRSHELNGITICITIEHHY